MKLRLNWYIFREMLGPFFISVLVFTVVLLLGRVLQLTEMVLTRGVSIASVAYLILAILPFVFVFTLPMSSLLSVLLAFLRMSSESEITAMKNAGLSLYQLLTPVIVFSLLLYGATSALSFIALPWGNYALKLKLIELARTKADIAIKESVFNNAFDKVVIYMRSYNHKERLMEDVLISDERDPSVTNTIVAPRGYLLNHPDGNAVTIRLYDGSISRVDKKMDLTQNISFDRYDVNLDLKGLSQFSNRNKKGKEMTYGEMLTAMKDIGKGDPRFRAIKIELQKKFVFPFSCLVMGLLGVPLGLQATNRRRSTGVLLGLFSFLVYYTLLSITLNLGEMQNFPIVIGMWTPNILFGILALYMLKKAAKESPIAIVEKVNEWAEGIMEKIRKIRS
jgi:lipopolysaccharide export system permease protein